MIISYCFICGKGCDSSPGGGVEGNGWSDMRTLLGLLCKLMSVSGWKKKCDGVPLSGQVEKEEDEEGTWDYYSSSQTCGDCYSVLVQMEQLHALLERTRSSLEHHVRQVESLVVKSGAENVACQSWTAPFQSFREQVIEASLQTTRFQGGGGELVPAIPLPPPNVKVELADGTIEVEEEWGGDNYSPSLHSPEYDEPGNNNGGGGGGSGWEYPPDPLSSPPPENALPLSPPPASSLPQPGPSRSATQAASKSVDALNHVVKTRPPPLLLELSQSKGADDDSWRRSPRNHHHTATTTLSSCFVRLEKLDPPMRTAPPPPPPRMSTGDERKRRRRRRRSSTTSSGYTGGVNRRSNKKKRMKLISNSDSESEEEDETTNDNDSPSGSDYAPSPSAHNNEDDDDVDEDSGSEKKLGLRQRRSRKSNKSSSSSTTTTASKFMPDKHAPPSPSPAPFFPYIIADASKDLYLLREGTFVSKTPTHLVCHAFQCNFRLELDYTTVAFQEMRTHIFQFHRDRQRKHPCLLCNNTTFPNRATFRAHLTTHHHQQLILPEHLTGICEACLMPMRAGSSSSGGPPLKTLLRRHMATHQSREEKEREETARALASGGAKKKKQKCTHEGCSYESKFPSAFRRHLNSHLPFEERPDVTTCAQCGTHVLKEGLKQHVIRRHNPELADTILMCPYCSRKYFSWENGLYQTHLLTHQGVQPYKCSKCDAAFTAYSSLHCHVKRVHEEKRPADKPPIKCDHCDKIYDYTKRDAYKSHVRKRHSDVVPRKWPKTSKLSTLGDEDKGGDDAGGGDKGPTQRWPCSFCQLVCSTKAALQGHLEEKHGVPPASQRKPPEAEVGKTKCTWQGCTYASSCSRDLRRHMQRHLPREERTDLTTCDQCGVPILEENLKKHVMRVHNPELAETILQCGVCDRRYFGFENSKYQAHLLTHQGIKPFMCAQCGAAFATNSNLYAHVKASHGPPPESPLKCDHCDRTFMKGGTLYMHVRRHHAELAPPNRMDGRSKKGSKLNRLGTTAETEEDEDEDGGGREKRPVYGPIQRWPCPSCDVICSQKCALKRHMRTKHGGGS